MQCYFELHCDHPLRLLPHSIAMCCFELQWVSTRELAVGRISQTFLVSVRKTGEDVAIQLFAHPWRRDVRVCSEASANSGANFRSRFVLSRVQSDSQVGNAVRSDCSYSFSVKAWARILETRYYLELKIHESVAVSSRGCCKRIVQSAPTHLRVG